MLVSEKCSSVQSAKWFFNPGIKRLDFDGFVRLLLTYRTNLEEFDQLALVNLKQIEPSLGEPNETRRQ